MFGSNESGLMLSILDGDAFTTEDHTPLASVLGAILDRKPELPEEPFYRCAARDIDRAMDALWIYSGEGL